VVGVTDISTSLLLAAAVSLPELLRRLGVSNTVIRLLGALTVVAGVAMIINAFTERPFKIELSEPYGSPIEISLWVLVLVGGFAQIIPLRSPASEEKTG